MLNEQEVKDILSDIMGARKKQEHYEQLFKTTGRITIYQGDLKEVLKKHVSDEDEALHEERFKGEE